MDSSVLFLLCLGEGVFRVSFQLVKVKTTKDCICSSFLLYSKQLYMVMSYLTPLNKVTQVVDRKPIQINR